VSVLGAWKNASGRRELDELFDHLANSFSDCTSYEFELLEAEVRGDTAYTVGFEHTSASVNGVPRTYTLRATQIYRREDSAWRVAHRHGSAPPCIGRLSALYGQRHPAWGLTLHRRAAATSCPASPTERFGDGEVLTECSPAGRGRATPHQVDLGSAARAKNATGAP